MSPLDVLAVPWLLFAWKPARRIKCSYRYGSLVVALWSCDPAACDQVLSSMIPNRNWKAEELQKIWAGGTVLSRWGY